MADKVKRTPAKLSKLVEDFDMEIVCRGSDYDQRTVSISDMNRPALQLVGFYDYFEPKRLQVFGKSEMTFLKAMKLEDRRRVFDNLLRCEIPALIIARNMEIFPELLEIARKHGRTLLRSELNTVELTSQIIDYLNRALAPQITRHGVLMNINGQGVLLLGESGIGKSETAIELLKRGHRLVADDAVEIRRVSDSLYGTAPELIRHYMELRGIGVVDIQQLFGMGSVRFDTELDLWCSWRSGWTASSMTAWVWGEMYSILGVKLPYMIIPVRPGRNLAGIVEIATMKNRQMKFGYNPARDFVDRVDRQIDALTRQSEEQK
ncbi:MAG: HPr(Ser) kinase/phosphatase [Oscillospiraceae bacterium]